MGMENFNSTDFQLLLDYEMALACAAAKDEKGYEFLNKICWMPKKSELKADSTLEFMVSKDANEPEPFKGKVNFNDIDYKTKKISTIDWGGEGIRIGRKLKAGTMSNVVDNEIGKLATAQINKPITYAMNLLYYANATSMEINGVTFDLTTFEGTSAELIETSHSLWNATVNNEVGITVATTAYPSLSETRNAVDYLIHSVKGFTDTSGAFYPFRSVAAEDFVFLSDTYMHSRLNDLQKQQASPERGFQNFTGLDSFSDPTIREASHDRLYAIRKTGPYKALIWLKVQEGPEVKVFYDESLKAWFVAPTFDWLIHTGDPRAIIMGRKA